MLIRWATMADLPAWRTLAHGYDVFWGPNMRDLWYTGFEPYMKRKIAKTEALVAMDRRSRACLGIVAFSREHRRISFFAVDPAADHDPVAGRLLETALRQLDTCQEIEALLPQGNHPRLWTDREAFLRRGFQAARSDLVVDGRPMCKLRRQADTQTRGHSFHYRFVDYQRQSERAFCPPCNHLPMPDGLVDLAELPHSFATAEAEAQGRLFGKCHVTIKGHYTDFEDLPPAVMAGFMADVGRVGKALRQVTGAVKINYEMHANSSPHLHMHLFPRYLDDDFPSAPIDYRLTRPSPYEDEAEYLWFVGQMQKALFGAEDLPAEKQNSPDQG